MSDLTVREFGQGYVFRHGDYNAISMRAWSDANRMLDLMRAACVDLDVTDVEVVAGPHLDVLRRYETVGWRIVASSPTFEFAHTYLQRHVPPESLWQHAKRSWKASWNRQRGRLS